MTNLLIAIASMVDSITATKKVCNDLYVETRVAGYPFIFVYDGNFGYYHITNTVFSEYFCTHYGNSQAKDHYKTDFYNGLEEAFAELQGDLEDAGLL